MDAEINKVSIVVFFSPASEVNGNRMPTGRRRMQLRI